MGSYHQGGTFSSDTFLALSHRKVKSAIPPSALRGFWSPSKGV